MNKRELCKVLHALYTGATVAAPRFAAWDIAMDDVDVRVLDRVVKDAARLWERMPTYPQVRAACLSRTHTPQPSHHGSPDVMNAYEPDTPMHPELQRWADEHPDSPWVRLGKFWEQHPPGTPISAEQYDYETRLRALVGMAPRSENLRDEARNLVGGLSGQDAEIQPAVADRSGPDRDGWGY